MSKRKHKKPNGTMPGTFLVSIDDGFVEYQYELKLKTGRHNIHEIWDKLRKAYRANQSVGKIRTNHVREYFDREKKDI